MFYLRCMVKDISLAVTSFMCTKSDISRNCKLHSRVRLWMTSLGDNSYVGPGTKIFNANIGKFCSIGPEVRIGGLGKHPLNWISTSPIFYSECGPLKRSFVKRGYFKEHDKVEIGHDVWIGAHSLIFDGVNIGNGAVIAAGAVVNRDVEPYSVVGGIPARLIKKRFNEEQIKIIQSMEWWDWSFQFLSDSAEYFRTDKLGVIKNLKNDI